MNPPSRSHKVWYNGSLRERTDASFLDNRAFRYGDGLIETIRMMRGELLFFHDHLERMFAGMDALLMQRPSHWDARFFFNAIERVLTGNGFTTSARIRIQVWRTGDGIYHTNHQGVDYAVEADETMEMYEFHSAGYSANVVTSVRKIHDRIANVKTSSAMTYIVAAQEAKSKNVNVGIVLNERSNVADAPGRNVFLVEKGRVVTPPLTDGCVAGVFRFQLLALLRSHKIVAVEESISTERLEAAGEIFVTNVVDGIQPITSFNKKVYPALQSKELQKLFLNHLLHAEG